MGTGPRSPCPVRARVLLSVALAVAQGKTVLACRLNITNATTLVPYLRGPLLAVPQNFFEKRVGDYQKANVMNSMLDVDKSFATDADF